MGKNIFLKRAFVFWIFVILLSASGVFAETNDLTNKVKNIVKDIVEKQGINESDITNITSVDYEDLPDAIEVKNVDTTNLEIYEVNVEDNKKPLYVITASNELFEGISRQEINSQISILNFGYGELIKKEEQFLKTSTNIETSLEKGYVMMRGGSITGISTNLEIVSGDGIVRIVIYRNGESVEFGNEFVVTSKGVKKDYDVQSEKTIKFEAGDVISVSVQVEGNVELKDVITMLELKNIY